MKLELDAEIQEYWLDKERFYVRLSVGGYMLFVTPLMSKEQAEMILRQLKARDET
jgi:hypothetical protein